MTDGDQCLNRPKAGLNRGQVEGLALEDISPFKTGGKKTIFSEMSIFVLVGVG